MINVPEHIDDLLVKYLLGEATPAERRQVEAWRSETPANEKYFNDFRFIWDNSRKIAARSEVNTDEAWARFQQRIAADAAKPAKRIAFPGTGLMRIAALLVVLVGAGGLLYYFGPLSNANVTITADATNTTTAQLPDGSVVVLNHHASLTYPRKFDGATRQVTLKGEGFFTVTPNKQKPFIITADKASVKVVGTSFNVKTTDSATEVVVETGIVELARAGDAVKVVAHQRALVSDTRSARVEANQDVLYNYYRTREFVCNGTPLWKLVAVLNEAFDASITIGNPAIRDMPLTATFREEPLEDMLQVITQTLNISAEKVNDTIILK